MKQISNTKLDLYTACGKKFYFKYIEGLDADLTRTPLLYGSAMDEALNYMLTELKERRKYDLEDAKQLFITKMNTWHPELNRLDFFKNELPEGTENNPDDPEVQEAVWGNICNRGIASLDVYHTEVIPQFKRIVDVQVKRIEKNADEDELIFIVDFIAELNDGRVVVFDNKTSSSKYPKNSVVNSQQLALYTEFYPEYKYAGYVVLIKNPEKEKGLTHQILVDEIPEETRKKAFDDLEKTLYNIKQGIFEKNEKSCFAYGKPCSYWKYCKQNDKVGLIERRKK